MEGQPRALPCVFGSRTFGSRTVSGRKLTGVTWATARRQLTSTARGCCHPCSLPRPVVVAPGSGHHLECSEQSQVRGQAWWWPWSHSFCLWRSPDGPGGVRSLGSRREEAGNGSRRRRKDKLQGRFSATRPGARGLRVGRVGAQPLAPVHLRPGRLSRRPRSAEPWRQHARRHLPAKLTGGQMGLLRTVRIKHFSGSDRFPLPSVHQR